MGKARRPVRAPRPQPAQLRVRSLRLGIAVHPWRTGALALAGLLLVVGIATTSLPTALADQHPRLALMLHPNHPAAMLSLTRDEREALLALAAGGREALAADTGASEAADAAAAADEERPSEEMVPTDQDAGAAPSPDGDAQDPAATDQSAPAAAPDASADTPTDVGTSPTVAAAPRTDALLAAEIAARREHIRALADAIIARAPLEAAAYRLLADGSDDPALIRQAMIDAVARSRRETVAVFWLLQHSYMDRDYPRAVAMADILLRTRPVLNRFTFSYLNSMVLAPEGREALVSALAPGPGWRMGFFRNMARPLAASNEPLLLFERLKETGAAPSDLELAPFLRQRIARDRRPDGAYNIWLQMLPGDQLLKVRPINNLDFSQDPTPLPFGWNVPRSTNAFVDFAPRPTGESGRILRVRFGLGRVTVGKVNQIAFLRPGTYRFSGQQRGSMSARRGMRWQVICFGTGMLAGQSEQLMGSPRQWRDFSFDLTIPDDGRCTAQQVRLIHDARTPSEQLASGDIQFQSLDVSPIPTAAGASQ
ncbi:hypothetical protein MWN33_00075 [Starkeya koreensis]|uniref:Uncharacterized protein n=1 Tax=Ancylobacter koreensis TaxID=266121 RepID=A0ABT0DGL7_9HYPH|nr:hypothetical protein [Ancylobacter koreensis]MCK0206426.1 hypothetical protein [Ancylobacter koreensis]